MPSRVINISLIVWLTGLYAICLMQIVHVEDIHAREAVHVEIPDALSDNTKTALKSIGISKLYSHQV